MDNPTNELKRNNQCFADGRNLFCDHCINITENQQKKINMDYISMSSDLLGAGPNNKQKKVQRVQKKIENDFSKYKVIADNTLKKLESLKIDPRKLDFVQLCEHISEKGIPPHDLYVIQSIILSSVKEASKSDYADKILKNGDYFLGIWKNNPRSVYYNEINYELSMIQSSEFAGCIFETNQFIMVPKYSDSDLQENIGIHPLYIAFFGVVNMAFEKQLIWGDSWRLLKSIIDRERIDPKDFFLFLNKFVTDRPEITGNDFESIELKKVCFHEQLRQSVINLRNGEFGTRNFSKEDVFFFDTNNKVRTKSVPLYIDKFLSVLDVIPVYYGDKFYSYIKIQVDGDSNTFVINDESPFLYGEPGYKMESLGTDSKAIIIKPLPVNDNFGKAPTRFRDLFSSLIVSGSIVFYIDRETSSNVLDIHLQNLLNSSNINGINSKRVEMPQTMNIRGQMYFLKSIVGYVQYNNQITKHLSYTIVFGETGCFYYSEDLYIRKGKLWDWCENPNANEDNQPNHYDRQIKYRSGDFKIKNIENLKYDIETTAYLYIYSINAGSNVGLL